METSIGRDGYTAAQQPAASGRVIAAAGQAESAVSWAQF